MNDSDANASGAGPGLFDALDTRGPEPDNAPRPMEGSGPVMELLRARELGGDARFFLRVESAALSLAHAHNKILSLSNSRTQLLAHQVASTHRIINSLNRRYLIADEVGLGKTVEAGLVLKELVYRHHFSRMLIVCPASLMLQWQNEMLSKFNERFTIIDGRTVRAHRASGTNPWKSCGRMICSLDFIKNKSFAAELQKCRWDAVIFDEAHRLRRDSLRATQAYSVAEILAERASALLLLSATPFRGKLEELYYLIALIDRNILGSFRGFSADYCGEGADLAGLRERISPVLIRRTKRQVGGFTRRHARTVRFELYPAERVLYDETTRYVAEEFNRALQTENRAVGFVMTVFQKLLDSSTHALAMALGRRLAKLSELSRRADGAMLIMKDLCFLETAGEERDVLGGAAGATTARTAEELRREIEVIRGLIALADAACANKKGERLKSLISSLKREGAGKFLIFTQFRATQDYLAGLLSRWNAVTFHGSMSRDEKEEAVRRFMEEADIMIATEAGGEGRNLQFCNIIINYDLPWSPLRIEQRIGRLHRFGQKSDVFIYNFSTSGTVAERVLEVLDRKLRVFEESIGAPDVLLGQMEDELRLNRLFMEMASGARRGVEVEGDIEERLRDARENYRKLEELTVAERLDFNYDEYYRVTLRERAYSNRRIERFAVLLMETDERARGLITRTGDGGFAVFADGPGAPPRSGTFDSARALGDDSLEFLAFGHPFVDGLAASCGRDDFGGLTGVRLIEWREPFDALVFYFVAAFSEPVSSEEIIPVAVPLDGAGAGDLDEIEEESLSQEYAAPPPGLAALASARIPGGVDAAFRAALGRLGEKTAGRLSEMRENVDLAIDPEIEKIRESTERRIAELGEKLAVQEARMKWYGPEMRGAVTRTKNLIAAAERERDGLLARYRSYRGVTCATRLLCAGMLCGRPPRG